MSAQFTAVQYTADNHLIYLTRVKTATRGTVTNGGGANDGLLGITVATAGVAMEVFDRKEISPRGVYVTNSAGTVRKFLPCYSPDATLYTGDDTEITIGATTYYLDGTRGESRKQAATHRLPNA